jgi:hypothetical protein
VYLLNKGTLKLSPRHIPSPSAVALRFRNVVNKKRYVTFQVYLKLSYAASDFYHLQYNGYG